MAPCPDRRAGAQASTAAAPARQPARPKQRGRERERVLSRRQALGLQLELKRGFQEGAFQQRLRDLEARHEGRTPAFEAERRALFMTVQQAVLPRYGFQGDVHGLLSMMWAVQAFVSDPEFVRESNEICLLLGLHEQLLPTPQPASAALPAALGRPRGIAALLGDRLSVYYMNVDPAKSSTSRKRQMLQEHVNPTIAAGAGYLIMPQRVVAVTPDSDAWRAAKAEHGQLVMSSSDRDTWTGEAANCILLSFREALRQAIEDLECRGPAFVLITEDDMVLQSTFSGALEAAAVELWRDPVAIGAMLHSTSLADNMLEALSAEPALWRSWPRYPAKPFRKNCSAWPGHPIIPDQPLVALLKCARLNEFATMYDQRLREQGWSPLDWALAHAPFGESGILRLTARNGFCKGGADLGTGSDRTEQQQQFAKARAE